ncbi:MAG TPA: von Willebrand factor type A domain-containing protein [Anaerolineae bacterium]|nr:von Willebrand factor type A domain-containing protein [Anaerolineae bacterium]
MSPRFARSLFVVVMFAAILLSACAPAAAPTAAPQAAQPQAQPRAVVVTKEVQAAPAQSSARASAMATSAPAAAQQAPSQPSSPADAAGQLNALPLPTYAAAPGAAKVCCPPTPIPWPTYPAHEEYPYSNKPFVDTREDNLSTFAMDVDTASYTKMRDYLRNGQMPPADLIRVEELVNYFKQEYPDPGEGAFSINLDGARSPFSPEGTYLLKVGLQGKHVADWQRKDATLTFVIDVSGSMADDNKMDMVKYGLTKLVDQLGPNDQVAIVAYSNDAWVVLEPTSIENRDRIVNAINSLYPMNSTNTEAGLRLGYQLAHQSYRDGVINRVVLATDGVANVGNTDPNVLAQYAQDYYGRNIFLSTIGVGRGDYNDQLLQTLADKGNGAYSFLDSPEAAERIFGQDLTATLQTIAKDAKVQVDFNPNVVRRYRLIGYEKRAIADQDFRNNSVDAGEVGAGHNVTALYEVELNPEANADALIVRIRYEDPDTHAVTEQSKAFKATDFQSDFNRTSPRFQLTAAVAQFAEILRGDQWATGYKMRDVLNVMYNVRNQLPFDNDVQEFTGLVEQAVRLVD